VVIVEGEGAVLGVNMECSFVTNATLLHSRAEVRQPIDPSLEV